MRLARRVSDGASEVGWRPPTFGIPCHVARAHCWGRAAAPAAATQQRQSLLELPCWDTAEEARGGRGEEVAHCGRGTVEQKTGKCDSRGRAGLFKDSLTSTSGFPSESQAFRCTCCVGSALNHCCRAEFRQMPQTALW